MNFPLAIVLSGLFAYQSTNFPVKKPYSSQKQPVHSWDVFMATPEAKAAAEKLHGNCGDADNQATMNACFSAEYSKADAHLQSVYESKLKKMKESVRFDLIRGQGYWLKYRDAECKLQADEELGGSIQPTVYYSCMKEMTEERQKRISNIQAEM